MTLFRKTRLNENSFVPFFHFNALFIDENAVKKFPLHYEIEAMFVNGREMHLQGLTSPLSH